ncbi:MAG: hypothetical protein ACQERC_10325 [Bacteroidota bacterium]
MYNLKLLDIVIQGVGFLIALMLLLVFGAYGYFYWISMSLMGWVLISTLLHFFIVKKMGTFRLIYLSIFVGLLLIGGITMLFDVSFAKINFYLQPFSILALLLYIILTIGEFQQVKAPRREDLDF